MNKETLEFIIKKSHELIDASSCSDEAREAAKIWLEAVGTDQEEAATKAYFAELKEDIIPVDGIIQFTESAEGEKLFGAEQAKEFAAHAREIKAKGALYCDCPACQCAIAILDTKAAE